MPAILHVYKTNQFRLPPRPQQPQLHHRHQPYLPLHSKNKPVSVDLFFECPFAGSNMILAGRLSTSQPIMFNGSFDVVRFFYFENVAAREKPEKEKTLELLCYLDGTVANYFNTSTPDRTLFDDGKDYQMVKASFISDFKPIEAPKILFFVLLPQHWTKTILFYLLGIWTVFMKVQGVMMLPSSVCYVTP